MMAAHGAKLGRQAMATYRAPDAASKREREVSVRSSNVWICGAAAITLMYFTSTPASSLAGAREAAPATPAWIRVQAPPAQAAHPPRPQPKAARKEPITGATGDAQLRQRVEQLEEQLVDMQVLVGTLESLARGGGGAPRPGASSGASESARIDVLETQVRAMASQLEQLSQQGGRLQSGRRDDGPPLPAREPVREPSREGAAQPPAGPSGFGSVVVTPQGARDPSGQIISSNPGRVDQGALPPAISEAGSSKELYETAYGYLLQQDYGAAEAAFEEFLRRYPRDQLTADAQYWLGETLFVQRRYKPAGQAFLRVVQQYRQSSKAPNSLLMLAMTLEQLGQKDCALFTELETKHPNAPQDIKGRARVVKQRVGC
jgi:tol-pal system protein YbgF